MTRLDRAFYGMLSAAAALMVTMAMPSCATSNQAEVGALTALAVAIPALEVAREEAYREGLAKADVKDFPALAAAEAKRGAAVKQLVRLVQLARQYLQEDSATKKAQKLLLLRAVVDAVADLIEAFSTGPLPVVKLPPDVLRSVQLLRVVLDALLPPAPAPPLPAPQDAGAGPRLLQPSTAGAP